MADTAPDQRLLDATVSVLAETGWQGVSLERVAERAGRSRVTLWRQGVSQETLLAALLGAVADDYLETMWPVLTAAGTGRDRLVRAITGLCEVIDRHLTLMLASDTVFHQDHPGAKQVAYLDPFVRFLREGRQDGSLQPRGNIDDVADVVFNTVAWTYTHLRGRHQWSRNRARTMLLELILHGIGQT
ncbi:MAG: TetR/AcrR family transcriptional regulator [Nocardioidaceae bacterium]